MSNQSAETIENLCYLPARDVQIPDGRLAEYDLCSLDDQKLGKLDGVLIDPAERRVRFFVVRSNGWLGKKRYLLSADETAHLEPEANTLRIDVEAHDPWQQAFDADQIRPFGEDDLLKTLFSSRVN